MINPRLKNSIIIVVTAIWAINFGAGVIVPGYEPDQAINAIFMAIVGGLFAIGRGGGGGSNGGSSKREPSPER